MPGVLAVSREGFSSGGTIQQQGLERYGGLSFNLGGMLCTCARRMDLCIARYSGPGVDSAYQRQVSRFGYGYRDSALKLDSEFVYTQSDEVQPSRSCAWGRWLSAQNISVQALDDTGPTRGRYSREAAPLRGIRPTHNDGGGQVSGSPSALRRGD